MEGGERRNTNGARCVCVCASEMGIVYTYNVQEDDEGGGRKDESDILHNK